MNQDQQEKKKNWLKLAWLFFINPKNLPLVASLLGGAAIVTTSAVLLGAPRNSSSQPSSAVTTSIASSSTTTSEVTTSSATPSSSELTPSSSTPAIQYTVTFVTLGGTVVTPITVDEGSFITAPTTKFGVMDLEGWYTSTDAGDTFASKWDFANDAVTSDLTLYANWEDPYVSKYQRLVVGDGFVIYLDSNNDLWSWGRNYDYNLGIGTNIDRMIPTRVPLTMLALNEYIIHVNSTNDHTTLLTNLNNVYVFGRNSNGKLGTFDEYTKTPTLFPVDLLPEEALQNVWATRNNTFFLTTFGRLLAMGENYEGELGIPSNDTFMISTPTEIVFEDFVDGERVLDFVHGDYGSFALTNFGRVFSWGYNSDGRLGNGDEENTVTTPLEITFAGLLENEYVNQLHLHGSTTVALTNLARVYGWGNAGDGQLATGIDYNGDSVFAPMLLDITFLSDGETIVQVYAGDDHTVFITDAGTFYQVGDNSDGQFATGDKIDVYRPITLDLSSVLDPEEALADVYVGDDINMFSTTSGRIFGVGDNQNGIIDPIVSGDVLAIKEINFYGLAKAERFVMTDVGENHAIALTSTNRIFVWGSNQEGELGIPTIENFTFIPQELTIPLNANETITNVYADSYTSFALTSEGRLFGWGDNDQSQLGNGGNVNQTTPIEITIPSLNQGETVAKFYPNYFSTYVLTTAGRVFGWGVWNGIGDGTLNPQATPVPINFAGLQGGETITSVYVGQLQRYAITSLGKVYAWGENTSYGLGLNDEDIRLSPTVLTFQGLVGEEAIVSIATNSFVTIALTSTGRIYGWGFNLSGQLGNLGTTNVQVPTIMPYTLEADDVITSIYANGQASFFLLANSGNLYAFGSNGNGQLGTGNTVDMSTPTLIEFANLGATDAIAQLAFSSYSTFAITESGIIYSWGMNSFAGKLGHLNTTTYWTPTPIFF